MSFADRTAVIILDFFGLSEAESCYEYPSVAPRTLAGRCLNVHLANRHRYTISLRNARAGPSAVAAVADDDYSVCRSAERADTLQRPARLYLLHRPIEEHFDAIIYEHYLPYTLLSTAINSRR